MRTPQEAHVYTDGAVPFRIITATLKRLRDESIKEIYAHGPEREWWGFAEDWERAEFFEENRHLIGPMIGRAADIMEMSILDFVRQIPWMEFRSQGLCNKSIMDAFCSPADAWGHSGVMLSVELPLWVLQEVARAMCEDCDE